MLFDGMGDRPQRASKKPDLGYIPVRRELRGAKAKVSAKAYKANGGKFLRARMNHERKMEYAATAAAEAGKDGCDLPAGCDLVL